jgi:hypothetical protein
MTKLTITSRSGVWLLPILFAAFTFNATGDTLSFAAVQVDPGYTPAFPPPAGTTSASYSATINGATNTVSANLANGMLGVLNAGTDVTTPGVYETIAQIGDTITATGSASGLSGLDLGVNITETGTTSFSDSSGNFSWLWVYMFVPGTFDQSQFTTPGNVLISRGYLLGHGTNTIPLQIPFNTIGSNFQIELVLGSAEFVSGASETWSADFLDPLNVTLSAPAGVTLTSASGLFPGTVVPEPSSLPLVAAMIALVILALQAKRRSKTT